MGNFSMLSRTADHLYWMARYTERAENTARLLDVNYQASLLPQSDTDAQIGWQGLLSISELTANYHALQRHVRRACNLVESGKPLLVGPDYRLRVIAFGDLAEHALAGLYHTHAAVFRFVNKGLQARALQRGRGVNHDRRPDAEIGRLQGEACAFREKKTAFRAAFFGVEPLQRLDQRV